jgi:hypothetical protein
MGFNTRVPPIPNPLADPPEAPQRPRVDWSKVAEGFTLVGFGVFLLLTTTGTLPWSFWLDAAVFWPVLLVSAGLRLVFDRSRAPWAVLIGPVLVLGTLVFVARSPSLEPRPGQWKARSADRAEGLNHFTFETQLAGGRVDVEARPLGPGVLVEGRSDTRADTAHLSVNNEGDSAVVRISPGGTSGFSFFPGRGDRWELALAQDLPVGIDVRGAFVRAQMDLRPAHVTKGNLEGAFNSLEVRLPRPDSRVRVRLAGVFSVLTVVVPAGTPVRLRTDGVFNWTSKGPATRLRKGERTEEPGYDVTGEGVFNSVTVEEAEAPAPAG